MGVCHLRSYKFCLIPPCASVSSSGMWASEPQSPQHRVFTGGSPTPPNSLSFPARQSLASLTPPSGRGRSPLHCRPSPWPGGRGSHHSAPLSCPESSLARRWSALSHDGSVGRGNVRPPGTQLRTQEPLLTPLPLSAQNSLPYKPFGRVISQQNLTKGVYHLPFLKCTQRK